MEGRDDGRYFDRLMAVTDKAGITVWVTVQDDLPVKRAVSNGERE